MSIRLAVIHEFEFYVSIEPYSWIRTRRDKHEGCRWIKTHEGIHLSSIHKARACEWIHDNTIKVTSRRQMSHSSLLDSSLWPMMALG